MELKSYQQRVINDLENYLEYASRYQDLRQSFHEYWKNKNFSAPPYKNNVPKVPHVCVKVPTAGGKTFIAANALRPIFDALQSVNAARPQVCIWLVPSLTILDQTFKNLSDVSHPYRQRLNTHFNGRVAVYNKQDVLQGANFSPDALRDQLSIIVLSFDSLRTQNKEGRKVYQENGYLAPFAVETKGKDFVLPDTDETALINVLRLLEPVLIVDESHNAETNLSVQMLQDLNPSFILDLTATPRDNSNIISYVDALELKKQHMVKLPVIVNNFKDKNDVIASAVQFRQVLENAAIEEAKQGGKPIRPIVLFQAQPRTGEESATFEKIKEQLTGSGLPEEQIKIKTAEINELKGVDLMDKNCPVRFIITINALKEGWDCPFAYILASLANKSSSVDVEQVLGRVLRQPYTQPHAAPILNTSYVFTASSNFLETLKKIVEGLNKAGFSEKDFREKDFTLDLPPSPATFQPTIPGFDILGEPPVVVTPPADYSGDEIDVSKIKAAAENINPTIENIIQTTVEQNTVYQQQADAVIESEFVPSEIKEKMNVQPMKDNFIGQAKQIILPQFYIKLANTGLFLEDDEHLFERKSLLKEFRLGLESIDITFENLDADSYVVDLEQTAQEDYKPSFRKLTPEQTARLREFIKTLPDEGKKDQTVNLIIKSMLKMDEYNDAELKKYVRRIVDEFDSEMLNDCLERTNLYSKRIKNKIEELATDYIEKVFNNYLDIDKITIKPTFTFPSTITPSANAADIIKSLYAHEETMNQFEARVINDIANLGNIAFWHRNFEKGKGFRINGFVNHYPDFIVVTKTGKIIIVETKGDDRDNSDSEQKIRLANKWTGKAGNNFKYFMIFDNRQLEGAYRLNDAVNLISQI